MFIRPCPGLEVIWGASVCALCGLGFTALGLRAGRASGLNLSACCKGLVAGFLKGLGFRV